MLGAAVGDAHTLRSPTEKSFLFFPLWFSLILKWVTPANLFYSLLAKGTHRGRSPHGNVRRGSLHPGKFAGVDGEDWRILGALEREKPPLFPPREGKVMLADISIKKPAAVNWLFVQRGMPTGNLS